MRKFKRKYYYSVSVYDKKETERVREYNFLTLSIAVMQELNNKYSVKKALEKNLFINKKWNTNLSEIYSKLIASLNFKSSHKISKYDLREKTFTKEDYCEYISDKLKNSD